MTFDTNQHNKDIAENTSNVELQKKAQYPKVPDIEDLIKGASWTQEAVCQMCGIAYPVTDWKSFSLARLVLKNNMEKEIADNSGDGSLLSITMKGQNGGLLICKDEGAVLFNEDRLKAIRRSEKKTTRRLRAIDHKKLSHEDQTKLDRLRLECTIRNQDTIARNKKIKQEQRLLESRVSNDET